MAIFALGFFVPPEIYYTIVYTMYLNAIIITETLSKYLQQEKLILQFYLGWAHNLLQFLGEFYFFLQIINMHLKISRGHIRAVHDSSRINMLCNVNHKSFLISIEMC